jgi:haloalkane dehalogenase
MNHSRFEEQNRDNLSVRDVTASISRGPSRSLDIGGGGVAYYRFGRGPDVLFVHGWPLHAATFRHIVPALAKDFTCHLIDLPGAGRSVPGPGAPIDLRAHAVTLRGVVDALGLGAYAILAHDSGGLVARHLAADDDRVRGLVLGNTEIPRHTPWLIALYAMMARVPLGTAMARVVLGSPVLRRSALGFGGCFEDPKFVNGEFADLFIEPLLRSRQATEDAFALIKNLDRSIVDELSDLHRQITQPVDLVWGTEDPFFPIAKAREMVAEFAGRATLHEIPNAKLFAHEDNPEAFVAIARNALASYFAKMMSPAREAVSA